MPSERPVFGQPVLIREPRSKRRVRVGVTMYTGAYPKPFDPLQPALIPSFGQSELGKKPMSYSAAIEHWKLKFRENIRQTGMDEETGKTTYQDLHFGKVQEIDIMLRELKLQLELGTLGITVLHKGRERFYTDPNFFRQKLQSKDSRAEELYELALIALRMDRVVPEKAEELDAVGFSLAEAAESASPNYPKYKLALWREYERKMEERRAKREKEAQDLPKRDSNVKTFHRYNASGVYEAFTPHYYLAQIEKLNEIIDSSADKSKVNWHLFGAQYVKFVRLAKMIRDTRNYNGNKIMYRPVDYDEMLRNEDPEAFVKGLAGLYAVRKDQRRIIEPKTLKLLTKAAEMPPPLTVYKPPEPWRIFVLYITAMELYRLLGEVKGKRKAKQHRFNDLMLSQKGGIPEELKNLSNRNIKTSPEEELPF